MSGARSAAIGWLIVFVLSPLIGCASSSEEASDRPAASPSTSIGSASALEGAWETDTIPAAKIRAVVLDAGFTRKDAAQVIGGIRTFRFELRFEDGGYELTSAWDGESMGVIEAGGYQLEGDDRLLLDTGDMGDTFLFALDLREDLLTLELIDSTEDGTAEDKYTHSYFTTAFFTGHPFTRSR